MTKEDLEKEAYLFAKNNKDVQNFECGFDIAFKSYLASAEPREKRIDELKNKIAELEKRNGELAGHKASLERWFGEAKKIIGNLYAICKDNHYLDGSVLMEQAEQFLKEIGE